jgi:hypothetical protein
MQEGDANVAALGERLPAPLVADFAWRGRDAAPPEFDRAALSLLGFGPSPRRDAGQDLPAP